MANSLPARFGGSFAPPINHGDLSKYRSLAENGNDEVRHYMLGLCDMMDSFLGSPPSQQPSIPHPSGLGTITNLDKKVVDQLWDVVPWPAECEAYQKVFEELPVDDLRNAAFHLLWYAKELADDRQPLTNDKLPKNPPKEEVEE